MLIGIKVEFKTKTLFISGLILSIKPNFCNLALVCYNFCIMKNWIIVGFIPLGAIVLIIWWLVIEAVPGKWYNPFELSSVMNCLVQWFLMLVLFISLNSWIVKKYNTAHSRNLEH